MFLFLLTAVPIAYLLLLSFGGQTNQPAAITLVPFVKGALLFLPVIVLLLILEQIVPEQFNPGRLYLRYALLRMAVPFLIAAAGALLVVRGGLKNDFAGGTTAVLSFMSGYYSVLGIFDTVANIGETDAYILFMLPTLRLVIIALVPFVLIDALRAYGFARVAAFLAAAAVPFALAAVPWLYRLGFLGGAVGLSAALVVIAAAVYLRFMVTRLPVSG